MKRSYIGLVGLLLAASPATLRAQEGMGGARSNGLVRDQVRAGYVPTAEAFTTEGFLSEHHFPVSQERCGGDVCFLGALGHGLHRPSLTRSGYLLIEPVSGVDPQTFQRGALNVGLVIDISGSMTGNKLSWALEGAHALVEQLGPNDRLSIVTFDDEARLVMPAAPLTNRAQVHAVIESIGVGGSTNLHAGLQLGFDQVLGAHEAGRSDRLFVLTDEQPNTGVTSEGGFLELVGGYARRGVALTVVGVGLDLGAELASAMSELEGGAYYYLEGAAGIESLFGADFDQRVTPVAYRLSVTVRPSQGLRVAEVFGVPGDNVTRNDNGSVTLRASTLFLDRRRSGVVVRLEPVGDANAALSSSAHLSYSYLRAADRRQQTGETLVSHSARVTNSLAEFADPHHYRAYALVNFAQLFKAALRHWHHGRRDEARRIMDNARAALSIDSRVLDDPQLAQERVLAERTLATMQGPAPNSVP